MKKSCELRGGRDTNVLHLAVPQAENVPSFFLSPQRSRAHRKAHMPTLPLDI